MAVNNTKKIVLALISLSYFIVFVIEQSNDLYLLYNNGDSTKIGIGVVPQKFVTKGGNLTPTCRFKLQNDIIIHAIMATVYMFNAFSSIFLIVVTVIILLMAGDLKAKVLARAKNSRHVVYNRVPKCGSTTFGKIIKQNALAQSFCFKF